MTNMKHSYNRIQVLALSAINDRHPAFHLVEFTNRDGDRVQHLIETKLLHKAAYLREHLSNLGFAATLDDSAWKTALATLREANPKERVVVTDRPGWVGHSYLCADGEVIGAEAPYGPLLLPTSEVPAPQESVRGTLKGWKTEVAPFALYSSRLMLAVCTSFSGFICRLAGMDSGGLHLFGSSSIGKSTGHTFSASVFGDRRFVESWAITAKASEEVMASRNDSVLIMDELAALGDDPRSAANGAQKFVYVMGEGRGKRRSRGSRSPQTNGARFY
jgi:putative DNA primase/helicase